MSIPPISAIPCSPMARHKPTAVAKPIENTNTK